MPKTKAFKTKLALLALYLLLTIFASFLPFSIGAMLGFAAICLTGYAFCLVLSKADYPKWFPILASALVLISDFLTLFLIAWHNLSLYFYISGLNLILILATAFIMLWCNIHLLQYWK